MSTKEPKLPVKVRREFKEAIKLRARAKAMESEAKGMTNEAKGILLPIMVAYSISTYNMEGVGKVSTRVSKGSSISGPKLMEELLIHGMDIADINKIITRVTNRWETEYVEFKKG